MYCICSSNLRVTSRATYQYLTMSMIATAKKNGVFTDQKRFKTAARYRFGSLTLTDIKHASAQWLHILNPS